MKKELQDKLFNTYPDIFRDKDKSCQETCMCWGISTGDGWYAILDDLCKNLTMIKEKYDVATIADQVKEKYGTLRFYFHTENGPRWTYSDFKLINYIYMNRYCKLPQWLFNIMNKPISILYSYYSDRSQKLDGKVKIDRHSLGWTSHGVQVFAGPGVRRSIDEYVNQAENFTCITCEDCGMTGATQNDGGWISTLCESCRNKLEKGKTE